LIAVMSAIHQEITGIKKLIRADRVHPLPGTHENGWRLFRGTYAGQEILLLQFGMGAEKAQRGAELIYAQSASPASTLQVLLNLGFGGALTPGLGIGDLILCQQLLCNDALYASLPCESDDQLLALAQGAMQGGPLNLLTGANLTVERPIPRPEEKAALGDRFQAQVVDMETYWIARFAAGHGIPFLAVRAISDAASESLPPFDRFISAKGAWLWKDTLRHFMARPAELAALGRLYRNSLQAMQSLTLFFQTFIPKIESLSLQAR
jgi:adenosylhomocysteine nucleosidase